MASFIFTLLFLLIRVSPAVSQSSEPAAPSCLDWGESSGEAVSVVEGDAGWLPCPFFSYPTVYNYSSTQSTGHNLFWYRKLKGNGPEHPITYSSRLSKDRDRLWLQPANVSDTGLYICMLRNKSSCSKIAMRLTVLPRDEIIRNNTCQLPVAGPVQQEVIHLQEGKMLQCPDLQDATKMADSEPTVSWYHITTETSNCSKYPFWNQHREQIGTGLKFFLMLGQYSGMYYCTVEYRRRGRSLSFSRSINVTAVEPCWNFGVSKVPILIQPAEDQIYTVKRDTEVQLLCKGMFPYLDSPWDIWWTVDGQTLDKLPDHKRFSKINRQVAYDYGDTTQQSILVIKDFQPEDLKREFNCSVKNERGFSTRRAQLVEEGEETDEGVMHHKNNVITVIHTFLL